MKQPI